MFNLKEMHQGAERAVCTTPWNATDDAYRRMHIFSEWFGCGEVERCGRSVQQLFEDEHAQIVIVADEDPIVYHKSQPTQGLFFHLGMAQQRLTVRTQQGVEDRLIRALGVQEGDHVLDATLGLGVDAMVISHAVGRAGRVTAVEWSWILSRLFLYGVRHARACPEPMKQIFLNIDVVQGYHDEVLRHMESNSVDVVYFDPMFRKPTHRLSSIDAGRVWTNDDPLSAQTWREAQRVARKRVVLKERPMSNQFERFNLVPDKRRAPFAYGVWQKEMSV